MNCSSAFVPTAPDTNAAVAAGPVTDQALQDAQQLARQAYVRNTQDGWQVAIAQLEALHKQDPDHPAVLLALAHAQYALSSVALGMDDAATFDRWIDAAEANAEKLTTYDDHAAEGNALLSAVYGLKIADAPLKGILLGRKTSKLLEKAVALDPQSPVVWARRAAYLYWTPSQYGGDVAEATRLFEKAVALYEQNPTRLAWDWTYLETLAVQGKALEAHGATKQAVAVYEKALRNAPEFAWVKQHLLPAAEQRLAADR